MKNVTGIRNSKKKLNCSKCGKIKEEDDDIEWITVNGVHIPIKPGEDKKDQIMDFFKDKNKSYRGISRQQYDDFKKSGSLTSDGRNMQTFRGNDFKPGSLHTTQNLTQAIAHAGNDGIVITIDRSKTGAIKGYGDIRRVKTNKILLTDIHSVLKSKNLQKIYNLNW